VDITILATDRQLQVIGDPITGWTRLEATLRFNEPSAASISLPLSAASAGQIEPGCRLVVIRDGRVLIAGPIEQRGPQRWSATGQDAGAGTIDVTIADDLASIVAERVHPDPSQPLSNQRVARREFTAVNAEQVMRTLVAEQVGPSARPERQIPRLTLGPVAGVGTPITVGFRFDALGDALRTCAIAGGGLGFRTTQVGDEIQFQVYQPVDRSGAVRFSRGLGNLRSYELVEEAPTATVAIVGDGSGTGTNRVLREYVDQDAVAKWGRIVTFVDRRDTTDTAELDEAGAEALASGAARARLSAITVDTPTQRWGVHYDLGDRVSVEVAHGVALTDVVREVRIEVTPRTGELVTAVVGNQQASSDSAWLRVVSDLARRVGRLEAI